MTNATTRRRLLGTTLTGAALAVAPRGASGATGAAPQPFRYALNMSTLRGQKLPLDRQITTVIDAGYDGIEPWVGDIDAYAKNGGSLEDLAKRCADAGVAVIDAIGFARWIVDDDAERAKGLEQMKRDMELVKRLGATHIAAPPVGAHGGDAPAIALDTIADRYHAVLEVGRSVGVVPLIEVWGFSKNLSTLPDALYAATACGHADAAVLADIYHLYRGGTQPEALRMLSKAATHCIHVNDYPDGPREKATDADRVMPGDGVAPLTRMLGYLRDNGCRPYLSLELFNRELWQRDAGEVAKLGLAKMKEAVAKLG